jgi:hypothetical protein
MTLSRGAVRGIAALALGLLTFLLLALGADDKGDEFLYGLAVGAIAWWLLGKVLPSAPQKDF